MTKEMGPPSLFDTMSEGTRTLSEYFALQAFSGMVSDITPRGNGQPVLVLPGLGGGDFTTVPIRDFLTKKGYTTYGWEHGINTGPDARTLAHLKKHLDDVYQKSGKKKVALIGHSLGGIYARELARAFPEKVSRVITLGSPFGMGENKNATINLATRFFTAVNGTNNAFLGNPDFAKQALVPPPVPTTSVYTRNDGVVNWQTCVNPDAPLAENIEVYASHCGLVVNAVTCLIVADRLAQDVSKGGKRWRPFEMMKYPLVPFPSQIHRGVEPVAQAPAQPVKLFP